MTHLHLHFPKRHANLSNPSRKMNADSKKETRRNGKVMASAKEARTASQQERMCLKVSNAPFRMKCMPTCRSFGKNFTDKKLSDNIQ